MHTRARKEQRAAAKKYPKLRGGWEASQYLEEVHGLRCAASTLAKKACLGTGPEVVYVNDIPFYQPTGLDAWAKATISKPTPRARKYDPPRNNRRQLKPANTEPPAAAA